jgi:hypothetical protein
MPQSNHDDALTADVIGLEGTILKTGKKSV